MKKRLVPALLLLGYCIPFVFLSMYGDAAHGTMWLYALMAVGFGGLCFGSVRARQVWIVPLGNVLSFLSSCLCIRQFSTEKWEWYFKPLTAGQFLLVISLAAFALQIGFAWRICRKPRKEPV